MIAHGFIVVKADHTHTHTHTHNCNAIGPNNESRRISNVLRTQMSFSKQVQNPQNFVRININRPTLLISSGPLTRIKLRPASFAIAYNRPQVNSIFSKNKAEGSMTIM